MDGPLAGERIALLDVAEKETLDALPNATATIRALGAEFVTDLKAATVIVLRCNPTFRSSALLLQSLSEALPTTPIVRHKWLQECWARHAKVDLTLADYNALHRNDVDERCARLFTGVKISLGAFDDSRFRTYCASVLRSHGATLVESAVMTECTHVLLPYSVPTAALQKLAKTPVPVTPFWLQDCVDALEVLPVDEQRQHKPIPKVTDMKELRISCTAYNKRKREQIRRGVLAAGAIPDFTLTKRHTHLLAPMYVYCLIITITSTIIIILFFVARSWFHANVD